MNYSTICAPFIAVLLLSSVALAAPQPGDALSFNFTAAGNTVTKTPRLTGSDKERLNKILRESVSEIVEVMSRSEIIEEAYISDKEEPEPSGAEIRKQDTLWQMVEREDAFSKKITLKKCSELLREVQRQQPKYAEIFVTDRRGLNICQTRKTSDYFQADESWWNNGFNKGEGKVGFEPLSYDKSSHTYGFAIYAPVLEPNTREVLGVAKALVRKKDIIGNG